MRSTASLALIAVLAGCGSVEDLAGVDGGGADGAGADAGRRVDAGPPARDAPSRADATVDAPVAGDGPTTGLVLRDNGVACGGGGQCASGFCVDGVCCATACQGPCEACDLPGAAGACAAVTGPPHGARRCLGQGTPCAGRCNGMETSTCIYPGSDTTCAPAKCTAGVAVTRSVCNGGACLPGTSVTCAPYGCAGDVCAGGCTADQPCVAGNYCNGGRCTPQQPNGAACQDPAACLSGACVDGHCCAAPSCGTCSACTGPMGTCQKVTGAADPDSCALPSACDASGACKRGAGSACARNGDCLSGFCVDKVCCNSACDGPCQSCKLAGSVGTCGTPSFASDPANCGACGVACPGTACLAGTCEKIQFTWSFTGPLAPPLVCIAINEPSDPDAWGDNYLCTQRDFGFRWSFAGPVPGLPFCTSLNEPSEPPAQMWSDNYLCAPVDYHLQWAIAGKPADPNLSCVQITEPSDPDAWTDNYLCAPK